jgi:hypothetical protein
MKLYPARLVMHRASIAVQFWVATRVLFPRSLYRHFRVYADRLLNSLCPSVLMHVNDCQVSFFLENFMRNFTSA